MKTAHAPTAYRHLFRQRADAILDALIHAPLPETYAEIISAARAVMTVDKMLCQLWPQNEDKEDALPTPAMPAKPSQPLNRHQRRAEAAREKASSQVSNSRTPERPSMPQPIALKSPLPS